MVLAAKTAVPNTAQRVGGARKRNPIIRPSKTKNVPTAVKTAISKHRPITPATASLMVLCEARRREWGYSFARVARESCIDKADVCRALSLKEEPSARTRGALITYFGVADASALSIRERVVVLLMEIGAGARQQAEAVDELVKLIELRTLQGPPEV